MRRRPSVRAAIPQHYPGARFDAVETVSGKVCEELVRNGALAVALGDAWDRRLHLDPLRMAVRRRRAGHARSRRLDDARLLRHYPAAVDLNVVAAFLTILGYSLNDTVVIYDRIREDLRKYRKMAIVPLIDLSLNETLSRTVVTSLTVLAALGVLLLFGAAGDLRARDSDLLRHPDRHLFLDLHLRPCASVARS